MTTIRDPEEKDYIKFAPAMFFAMKQKNANEGYYLIVDFDGTEK